MIRFIDLGKQIGLDENWQREFSFFNTYGDSFETFNYSQVWDSWQDFEDDFNAQQKITGKIEEIYRYKKLCGEWVFKVNDPKCIHNKRSRSTTGFFCNDCNTFFECNSPTYRQSELISSIWMVLHNLNVQNIRAGNSEILDVAEMKDKIGIGILHENFEELIKEAEKIMEKYGKNSTSCMVSMQ